MRFLTEEKILSSLVCPICKSPMKVYCNGNATLSCSGLKKHSYDFSARGYVNFAPPVSSGGGDSKQAVVARSDFLNLELYRPIAEEICKLSKKYCHRESALIVDAGCGEGYYSVILADEGFSVFGVDLSKHAIDGACKRANAKNLSNAFFAVSSVYDIPVEDHCADAVINVFAPFVEEEYFRVVKDDGVVIVAYAAPNHLLGLKAAVYNEVHTNDGREDLPQNVVLVEEKRLNFNIELTKNSDIKNLFAMTPYYWRTSKSDFEKLDSLNHLSTEIDVIIAVYKTK